jgi:SAM-dependent methyltransferase
MDGNRPTKQKRCVDESREELKRGVVKTVSWRLWKRTGCVVTCGLCEGAATLLWPRLNMWKCHTCGLMFKRSAPKQLHDLYERSWAKPDVYTAETGSGDTRLARIYARKLAQDLGLRDFSGLKILDFGAGKGAMHSSLQALGAEVYSVEPYGYQYLLERGFRVFRSLNELPAGPAFDGIMMCDVIEHLEYPWKQLEELRGRLADGGWICVTTPNSHGLNARIFSANWREAVKDGHINLFCPRACEIMWKICGFSKHKRLRWFYRVDNALRSWCNLILKVVRLDGGLSYLVWN